MAFIVSPYFNEILLAVSRFLEVTRWRCAYKYTNSTRYECYINHL